eukprot:c22385_g1_i2 orf=433-1194(+)
MTRSGEENEELASLQVEVESLHMQERKLDDRIREMRERLRVLTEDENKQWLYVTEEDIKCLPCFQNETLIAIKAPQGTTLEVPDPDEAVEYPQRRYQMLLRSATGPIDVYLVSQFEEKFEEMNAEVCMGMGNGTVAMSTDNPDMAMSQEFGRTSDICNDGHGVALVCSGLGSPQDFVGGIMKIVPAEENADSDYWLLSDAGVSITDMWKSDSSNAMWDDDVKLSPSELCIVDKGLPEPQTPSSSTAVEVTSMS